jgi:hypothetical protein
MQRSNRRVFFVSAAAAAALPLSAGCGSDAVDEAVSSTVADAVADVDTATLEEGMVALRGFEIVAWEVGKRVIWLPVPAIRIIGVSLIVSAGVTKLVIRYLDVELKRRESEEILTSDEVVELESAQKVSFQLENGYSEDVVLGANQYE